MTKDQIRGSNIVQSIIRLKQTKSHMEAVLRIVPATSGSAKHFKRQIKRIDDIFTDTVSITVLSDEVRAAMRLEWASDEFTLNAITEKAALLSPAQKDNVEKLIDMILEGKPLEIIEK